ncbi:hypothetical protein [Paenibacillus massiliensis]|uniref:hypothetical protein n=1 Tax=Paenibacillus massiliensis TaxID=225917 RepID=UPI00037ECF14|nr:hypothetical protein [Paenibacillus massiliensis]
MKRTNQDEKSSTTAHENLLNLLKEEGHLESAPDINELYDRLYKSLYLMRDFSTDFERQETKTFKKRILNLYRKVWRIGASPYIRYHNQFHATLINLLYLQHVIIEDLKSKVDKE